MEGIIKWFNVQKRFGFILGEDKKDYFVHMSALNGAKVNEKDKVEFEPVITEKGNQATKVKKK